VAAAGRYGALRAQHRVDLSPAPAADRAIVAAVLQRRQATADGRALLDEAASKELLRAYGIRTPRERVAAGLEEALQAAAAIGYPVVLKLVAADVQHKSDIGGVILGIKDAAGLRAAHERLADNFARARAGAGLDRVLVAQQVSNGIELVLGVQRDPEVGLVVMFGTGGVLLELHKDVSFGAVPLAAWQAKAMIERTTAGRLLRGYRGAPPLDQKAVLSALMALGQLAYDLRDEIESIDINPLVALPAGEGAVALDALVVLRK
jgi:acyl-CoA synthetase (NDP forming)